MLPTVGSITRLDNNNLLKRFANRELTLDHSSSHSRLVEIRKNCYGLQHKLIKISKQVWYKTELEVVCELGHLNKMAQYASGGSIKQVKS